MRLIFMAHPVRGNVKENIRRAKQWVRRIEETYPDVAVQAPWIVECEIWDDSDEIQRRKGIARNKAVIRKCNALWLVDSRVSPGMAEEAEFALLCGVPVSRVPEVHTIQMGFDWSELAEAYDVRHL